MGGQACILYGAAEFSRDTDIALHASSENLERLREALRRLNARRVALPPFEQSFRPLLKHISTEDEYLIEAELEKEQRVEREIDRRYWEPLFRELEELRHAGYDTEEEV